MYASRRLTSMRISPWPRVSRGPALKNISPRLPGQRAEIGFPLVHKPGEPHERLAVRSLAPRGQSRGPIAIVHSLLPPLVANFKSLRQFDQNFDPADVLLLDKVCPI